MFQFDKILKMYAENGLRTVEDWTSLGRDLIAGVKPRADTVHRGLAVALFSKDQTHQRAPSTRTAKAALPLP
jgi:hypothetical protein